MDNNKRIYYFQIDNMLEVCYITEGLYVKSFVNLDTIPSKESFFSDDMFIGATKLLFRIPDDQGDVKSISDVLPIESVIEETITEETEAKINDLQKEGVYPTLN